MQIAWTQQADEDIDQIFVYLLQFNPKTASRTISDIQSSVLNLQRFPEIGKNGRVTGTREMTIPNIPYTVIYRVFEATVEIISVIHQARQWPDDCG